LKNIEMAEKERIFEEINMDVKETTDYTNYPSLWDGRAMRIDLN
jgi:hypothetical protein